PAKPRVTVSTTAGNLANPSGKRAWEWTDAERLQQRFDATSNHDRVVAYAASHPNSRKVAMLSSEHSQAMPSQLYVIDGQLNPELFLRHELLDALLRGFAEPAAMAEQFRSSLAPSLASLGFSNSGAFWKTLGQAVHDYLALRDSIAARHSGRSSSDDE